VLEDGTPKFMGTGVKEELAILPTIQSHLGIGGLLQDLAMMEDCG